MLNWSQRLSLLWLAMLGGATDEGVMFQLLVRDQRFTGQPLASLPGVGSSVSCAAGCRRRDECRVYQYSDAGCLLLAAAPTDAELTPAAGVRLLTNTPATPAPASCPADWQLVGNVCYHIVNHGSMSTALWSEDSAACEGLDAAATLATFETEEEYNFLSDMGEYMMLNMKMAEDGQMEMVGRADSSVWTTKWKTGEPDPDDVYGSMYSDGLLHGFQNVNFGRRLTVCQIIP